MAHAEVLCNSSDIAVSANGSMFVATDSYVEKVLPDGTLVRVAGRQGTISSDGAHLTPANIVSDPGSLAFDGAGNLDIWSWEPRTIFQLTPQGTIRALGGLVYATQLATSPDGTVLFGSHGGGIYQVTASGVKLYNPLTTTKITGLRWPRETAFQADGVAVSRSGAVYVANSAGNGYGDGNALVEVAPGGGAHVVPVHTPVTATFPAPGATGYPLSVYPPARPAQGRDLAACPSPEGLQPFDAAAIKAAGALVANYNAGGVGMLDLADADRSWWAGDFDLLDSQAGTGNTSVVSVQPASRDTFAGAVAAACGEELVRESIVVDVGPSADSFAVGHLYVLDRLGHPLVYFEAS